MKRQNGLSRWWIVVAALAACACGSNDDEGTGCDAPVLVGTPFGSSGTATVTGSGTLPPGIPNGLQLQLLLGSEGFSAGVLPDNLFAGSDVCGTSFSYTIKAVEAGTYHLEYDVWDNDDEALEPAYHGASAQTFTVSEGQTLTYDVAF